MLISFNGYPLIISSLMPDNGLASLAASLIEKGHETLILDYSTTDTIERLYPSQYASELQNKVGKVMNNLSNNVNPNEDDLAELRSLEHKIDEFRLEKTKEIAKEISDAVSDYKPDFVGFKLWLGEGFEGPLIIASELKRRYPSLPIFAGGPQVDWFKKEILNVTDVFDALAYGEGEETIIHLADYARGRKKLDDIPNLIFRKDKDIVETPVKRIEDMDSIPDAVYDKKVYPAMRGDNKIKMFLLDESRGCPYSCNFCIHPIKSGKKWRVRSPKRIVDFIEKLGEEHNTNSFRFSGSNTPASLKMDVAREILKRGLDITYASFAETRSFVDWKLLRESGNYASVFGVESGSQYILDKAINKKANVQKALEAVRACKEAGIFIVAAMIIPSPYETESTEKESLDFLLETKPDSVIISLPGLVPGTEWGNNPEKYNICLTEEYNDSMRRIMKYKIKFGLPPSLWEPLPYTVNGKSFEECSNQSGNFGRAVESAGIITQLTDEQALMAYNLGMDAREFRDKNRTYLATGNSSQLRKIVADLNKRLGAK